MEGEIVLYFGVVGTAKLVILVFFCDFKHFALIDFCLFYFYTNR